MSIRVRVLVAVWAALAAGVALPARAQVGNAQNPVFVNDSPAATETLFSIHENLSRGNVDQSLRLIQKLLDEQPDALVASRDDAELYSSVRSRVHALLHSDPDLLARYRRVQSPLANEALAAFQFEQVERSRFLTPAGVRAAAWVATRHTEAARFDAALLTLRQLDSHPDRAVQPGAGEVRAAAEQLARYLPAAVEFLAAWPAGGPKAASASIAHPPHPPIVSALHGQGPANLDGLVAQPLSTSPYSAAEIGDAARVGSEDSPFTRELRSLPVLMGDTVFIASARGISAFDRFTLTPRWAQSLVDLPAVATDARPGEERGFRGRNMNARPEDIRTVAVRRSILVTAAASEPQSGGEAREALAAFDPATGRPLWALPLRALDPELERAHIRGPVIIHPSASQTHVAIRKDLRERRLRALYLATLDAADGAPVWLQLVGSSGSLPYQPPGPMGDAMILHEGALYTADRIGLLCAYEAASGRPIWVRRLAGEAIDGRTGIAPWQFVAPIVRGDKLITLAPDRRSIVTVERATGRLLSSVPVDRFPEQAPAYLLSLGDQLAIIGDFTVSTVPIDNITSGVVRQHTFDGAGIRGRVVVAGDQLLVPLERAVEIVTADEKLTHTRVLLDDSGNILCADDQVLVADDSRLHSYLSWTAADRVLSARITAAPADPAPGIALAELAYRSGHDDRILAGVDAARGALTGSTPDNEHLSRLVASLRAMIDQAQNGASPQGRNPLTLPMVGELVTRLGQVAQAPEDRAAHQLVLGQHQEDTGQFADAAGSYQAVLDSPDLSSVMWQGPRLSVAADTEATRRLEALVATRGRDVYSRFERLSETELAALPPDPTIEQLERLARRYPVALTAPRVWDRIATAHEADKRSRAAARALELGLQSAERIPGTPAPIVGELAGRLVTNLLDRGLVYAADEAFRRVRTSFGEVPLTVAGLPIDSAALLARIGNERTQNQRWPNVGPPSNQSVQVLAGWTIMDPVVQELIPSAPTCLALRHQDGRLALFAPSADGTLASIWTFQSEQHQAQLLRMDRGSALIYSAPTRAGGLVLKVDTQSGRQLWATEPFAAHFPVPQLPVSNPLRGPQGRGTSINRVETPLEGSRPTSEVIFSSDERTFAIVERTGRAVAFDSDSGQRLWAAAVPLAAVFDSAVFRNLLAVAGETDQPVAGAVAPAGLGSRQSALILLDARTGDPLHSVPLDHGPIRWIRFTTRGDLIAGLTGAVVAIDTELGTVAWKNTQPPCAATMAAWVHGENVLIQAENRQVWLLSATTGLLRNAPVDTRDRLESGATPRALLTEGGDLVLSTPQGMALLSPDGSLLGVDALGGAIAGSPMLPPAPAKTGFVVVEAESSPRDRTGSSYHMHLLDARSAMIQSTIPAALGEPPTRVGLLDGRIAVSGSTTTVVFLAPPAR